MMWERFRSTNGFSLLELLIVIGVIGILAGTLIFSVVIYIEEAKNAKTRAIIEELGVHLTQYETEKFHLPFANELVSELEKPDNQGVPYYEFLAESLGGPAVKYERVMIMDPVSGALSPLPPPSGKFVMDAWNRPLYYIPSSQYGDLSLQIMAWNDENGNSVADANETFYQPATYQFWSAGADGIVRGVDYNGRLIPAPMLRRDSRDNDLDGLFDKDDTEKASSGKAPPANRPEDDIMRGG
jgi:prepilin-type N-terminal cleavage/methylation domain-containing protein